jgi:lactate racemase
MNPINLAYGKSCITFSPPRGVKWQVLVKDDSDIPPINPDDEQDVLQKGIQELVRQLYSQVNDKSRLLLVVPDHTRRCGLERILPRLLQELPSQHIEILIANGSHVLQPEANIRELVGDAVYDQYPVFQHDAHDNAQLAFIGETDYGTPIWLNRKVVEADFIVTIGGVLFHYFAGFGGGPKMLMPGVAGYETIRLNHRRTIDDKTGRFHALCREGNIDTNPVYLDLVQVLKFITNCISFQLAIDPEGRIIHTAAGPVVDVQRDICKMVEEIYSIPIKHKADVVVASAGGFPTDANLIQSHKSIHHAFQAVNENGMLIILAQCPEGIGSQTFMPYFELGDSAMIGRELLQNYKINGHTALTLRTKAEKARIIFVSELPPELVQKTGMIHASNIENAWDQAKFYLSRDSLGYIMPTAQLHVPVMG